MRLLPSLLLSLGIASSASAVTIDWTFIGNPGSAGDSNVAYCGGGPSFNQPCGTVGYAYNIGTYEVTNAQYAEFLNAKATSDPLGLYNVNMGYDGSIVRSGSSGSYSYLAAAAWADRPVELVDFYNALRFANWMNNGQGSGSTETGAYTLLGGTEIPSNGTTITRNAGANIFLPSEDEWYKAAYYDAGTATFFRFPTGSNAEPTCTTPTATPNSSNCNNVHTTTIVGSYAGSPSPYGTFDQGGNVWEWTEARVGGTSSVAGYREIRGGGYQAYRANNLDLASETTWYVGSSDYGDVGIRLAAIGSIPEPGTGILVIAGLVGLVGWRKGHY